MLHLAEDGPGAALSRAFPIALSSSGELAQSRPFGRSLRFPTLRLAVSPTGRARLRSHRARMGKNLAKYNVALTRRWPGSSSLPGVSHRALFRHRRRAMGNLAKYNVHSSGDEPKRKRSRIPNEKPQTFVWGFHLESGNVLLSRAVSSQVPSALKGLTSVFGMGTGGSLSP